LRFLQAVLSCLAGEHLHAPGNIGEQVFRHWAVGERVVTPLKFRLVDGPWRELACEKNSREPAIARVRARTSPNAVAGAHPARAQSIAIHEFEAPEQHVGPVRGGIEEGREGLAHGHDVWQGEVAVPAGRLAP